MLLKLWSTPFSLKLVFLDSRTRFLLTSINILMLDCFIHVAHDIKVARTVFCHSYEMCPVDSTIPGLSV